MKALILLFIAMTNFAHAQLSPMAGHEYTDVKGMEKAMQIWNNMKKRELQRNSECFNRAHAWAYDMWKQFDVSSRKILIHFSYKYNKELSNKWGFHIAPMISIDGVDYVMDRKYFDRPVTVPVWQAYFVGYATRKLEEKRQDIVNDLRSNRRKIAERESGETTFFFKSPEKLREENNELLRKLAYLQVTENEPASITCPQIDHIEQIDFNPNAQWCYLQNVSMYYWGYPQLRLLNYGQTQIPNRSELPAKRIQGQRFQATRWDMDQIWEAREEAFNNSDELWPYEYAIKRREECRRNPWKCS